MELTVIRDKSCIRKLGKDHSCSALYPHIDITSIKMAARELTGIPIDVPRCTVLESQDIRVKTQISSGCRTVSIYYLSPEQFVSIRLRIRGEASAYRSLHRVNDIMEEILE